jgi:hypothetical protein
MGRPLLPYFLLRVERCVGRSLFLCLLLHAIFVLLVGAVGRGRWSWRWRRSSLAASGVAHGKGGGLVGSGATVEVV